MKWLTAVIDPKPSTKPLLEKLDQDKRMPLGWNFG